MSLIVQVGMWTERFMLIVTSLHRDYIPTNWGTYRPTFFDWSTLVGSMGLFLLCFLLFVRFLPVISISEMRELVKETKGGERPPDDFEPKYAQ
jgi:molybdopterin-containing oxidoreductase family membrane subunit